MTMKQSVVHTLSRWSPSLANKALSTGLEAYRSGDYARALAEFRPLAKLGNAEAQAFLGRMYQNGEGISVNLAEAARCTQSAAEAGVPGAQYNLGVMYADGIGVSQDVTKALRWYRLAAQWGIVDAQANLSHCFHEGLGVDRDESLAAWWVSLAAEQGDIDAQVNLGMRYQNGIGVTTDAIEAYKWFDVAAKSGSTDAMNYRAALIQDLTPNQVEGARQLSHDLDRKPKTAGDSALQIFKIAAFQTIDSLKQTLGEEHFAQLRITERKAPGVGKIILEETHGARPATIVKNIKNFLAELEQNLDLRLSTVEDSRTVQRIPDLTPRTAVGFIRRIDDLVDVGTVLGEGATGFTHNLLEYHLSLIGELDKRIDLDSLEMLLKRFSLRQALRAPGAVSYSGLHNVVLPLLPW